METGSGAPGSGGARLAAALDGEVRALLQAIQGSAVEEIRLERDGTRIALRRAWQTAAQAADALAVAAVAEEPPPDAPPRAAEAPVCAPMVGVFHHSREPDGPPLARTGDRVDAGRPLGVIETLGMANDVESSSAGRLVFLLDDGQPVEYGQLVATVALE